MARARPRAPSTYDGDTADRRPGVGPQERQRRAHQPRDAARGHPPVARAVGDVPHAAALRRRRRAAHAARHLRQPRRARAAPAAAAVRALRRATRRSASRARPSATRASWRRALCGLPVEADRRRRLAAAPSACSRAGNARSLDAHSGARASANVETAELLSRFVARRPPDARVHPQPPRRRARRAARAPARSRRPTPGLARPRSPRTAPATSPEERRELERELASGELARRRGHERARARHRRRRARRGGAQRLPRHARVDVAAGRAGPGAPAGGRRRCSSPATTSSTSGTPPIPRELTRPPAEARGREPRRTRSCCAPRSRARRTSCRSRPTTSAGSATASTTPCASSCTPTCSSRAAARMYWSGRRAARAPTSGCAAGRRSSTARSTPTRSASIGTVDDARVFARRAPGRGLPAPGPAVPRRASSTSTTTSRCSSRRRRRRVHPAAHRDRHRDRRRGAVAPRRRGDRAPRRGRGAATRSSRTSASRSRPTSVIEVVRPRPARARARRRARAGTRCPLDVARGRRHRAARSCSARCTRPSTALIGMLPLFTICDRWDVGGVSMALHPQTGEPTIFVYDGYPGGAGIAELAFDAAHAPRRARRSSSSPRARATTAARRACSRRSAATGTSTSTRTRRSCCSRRSARRATPPTASPTSTSRPSRFRRMTRVVGSPWWCSSPSASGCWSPSWRSRGATTRPAAKAPTVYHEGDTIEVAVGEEFVVALPGQRRAPDTRGPRPTTPT